MTHTERIPPGVLEGGVHVATSTSHSTRIVNECRMQILAHILSLLVHVSVVFQPFGLSHEFCIDCKVTNCLCGS